jgi:hypothetical protein
MTILKMAKYQDTTQYMYRIQKWKGRYIMSCLTDTFNSESQPDRITLDADYIRDE